MEEVVKEFEKRYWEIYGNRDLRLTALDKGGVQRFLAHYLTPVHIPEPALFELDGAVHTVSTLIHRRVSEREDIPQSDTITDTLLNRVGDSFEASNLLASLLLGAGFDAYVVRGTADVSLFPLTQAEASSAMISSNSNPSKSQKMNDGTFRLPKSTTVVSKHLAVASELLDKAEVVMRNMMKAQFALAGAEKQHVPDVSEVFWVWVQSGTRGLDADVQIHPHSGTKYRSQDPSPFMTVDCIYNHRNVYVHVYRNRFSLEIGRSDLFERVLSEADRKGLSNADVFDIPTRLSVHHPPLDKSIVRPKESDHGREGVTADKKTSSFAPYSQPDGLVSRVIAGPDDTPLTVVEDFKHRRDKLIRREFHPLKNLTVEAFEAGRPDGLKELRLIPGVQTSALYYNSRLDGLVELLSKPGKAYIEKFNNRYDNLIKYSVKFVGTSTLASLDSAVSKISRAYAPKRDIPTSPADSVESVFQKISFRYIESTVSLVRHERTGELLPRKLIYSRREGSFSKAPSSNSSIELTERQIAELVHLEKSGKAYYNEAQARLTSELESRHKEELLVRSLVARVDVSPTEFVCSIGENSRDATLEISVYDLASRRARGQIEKKQKSADTADTTQAERADILAPYLLDFGGKQLDALQAEFVVKKVKNDFRKRLLDRAAVMQKRLEDEQEQLRKRRAQMQRRGDVADKSEGDFEKYQQLAMFRIQILEQSLARHEMQAIKKFTELEKLLSEDSRLAAMWVKH